MGAKPPIVPAVAGSCRSRAGIGAGHGGNSNPHSPRYRRVTVRCSYDLSRSASCPNSFGLHRFADGGLRFLPPVCSVRSISPALQRVERVPRTLFSLKPVCAIICSTAMASSASVRRMVGFRFRRRFSQTCEALRHRGQATRRSTSSRLRLTPIAKPLSRASDLRDQLRTPCARSTTVAERPRCCSRGRDHRAASASHIGWSAYMLDVPNIQCQYVSAVAQRPPH